MAVAYVPGVAKLFDVFDIARHASRILPCCFERQLRHVPLPDSSPHNTSRVTPRKISLFLPSLAGGGAERVFVELANEFRARDHGVDLVLASARGPYLAELDPDVRVIDLQSSGVLRSLPGLVRYLRRETPDVLLSALDHANIVAVIARAFARRGTRSVISTRAIPSVWYRQSRSPRSWALVQLMRLTYRLADAIIVNSEAGAADLEHFLQLPRARVSVIFNPVDIDAIDRLSLEDEPHEWCQSDSCALILGIGRLAKLKDFSTLVRAFALIRAQRDCRLVILGEGPYRERLELLLSELGIQEDAYLPGFIANPYPWMRNADVFVSSSLVEGCPNAVLQALTCGTPVVSTDCLGGSAETLQGGKWGRLVPIGDATAMAAAIGETLDTVNTTGGRQRARDFAPARIVEQYLQVLLPDQSPQAASP